MAAGIVVGVASLATPTPSYAWCSVCADVAKDIVTHTKDVITAVNDSANDIIDAIHSSTESIVGVSEKRTAAEKELVQGDINYRAAVITQDNVLDAQEQYTSEQSRPYQVCELAAQQKRAVVAADKAYDGSKKAAAQRSFEGLYPLKPGVAIDKTLDKYDTQYCSDADATKRGCTAVETLLQSAPVRSDILMAPAANYTYSAKEYEAAGDFIKTILNPVKPQDVPLAVQKTDAGKAHRVAKMNAVAKTSVAAGSFEAIRANKKSDAAGTPNAAGYDGGLSILGLMQKFAADKFGNKEYSKQLQVKNESGLLKEINLQMAFTNWVGFNSYIQNERIETILATKLAQDAFDNGTQDVNKARARVAQ